MALGEADQPGHLLGDGQAREGVEGPLRGAFLGAVATVVHAVVEPRGQLHGQPVEVLTAGRQLVDAVQDLGEVAGVVVATVGGVRRQQRVADLGQVRAERPPRRQVGHQAAARLSTSTIR